MGKRYATFSSSRFNNTYQAESEGVVNLHDDEVDDIKSLLEHIYADPTAKLTTLPHDAPIDQFTQEIAKHVRLLHSADKYGATDLVESVSALIKQRILYVTDNSEIILALLFAMADLGSHDNRFDDCILGAMHMDRAKWHCCLAKQERLKEALSVNSEFAVKFAMTSFEKSYDEYSIRVGESRTKRMKPISDDNCYDQTKRRGVEKLQEGNFPRCKDCP